MISMATVLLDFDQISKLWIHLQQMEFPSYEVAVVLGGDVDESYSVQAVPWCILEHLVTMGTKQHQKKLVR